MRYHSRAWTASVALAAGAGFLSINWSALARDGRKVTHWVVGQTASQRIAIDPVSKVRRLLPGTADSRLEVVSPDGSLVAVVLKNDSGALRAGLNVAEISSDGTRSNNRLLIPASEKPVGVQWLPSGMALVCAHGKDRESQIYLIDLERKATANAANDPKIVETRLSDGADRAFKPRVASNGTIAWLALRDHKNKQHFIDLMVVDKPQDEPRTLVARQDITAYDFSPDATTIVYSTHGEMTFISATTGEKTSSREYPKIDERMYSYHAHSIAWSPDGREIAAAIRFSGGRMRMDDQPFEPMFGDRELFIIPLAPDEKPSWVTLDDDCLGVEWMKIPRQE